jgi:tRNA modification GTPase
VRKNENLKQGSDPAIANSGMARPLHLETIAAISTPPGIGAVAVVRISGPDSWQVGRSLVKERAKFDRLKERENSVFTLVNSEKSGELDRALVVKYRAPESYTGEDVIEIQCHGGLAVPAAVCEAAISAGARTAQAGEFTRRAFLNGKLDLAQAEAVDELIHARGEQGRKLAYGALKGELGSEVGHLREILLELKAEIEYGIDFPDEDPLENMERRIKERSKQAKEAICRLLEGAERNLLLNRGVLTVIAGAPNVGKSSVFNRLLGKQRSIVTEQAGTTRDAVEMETMIEGMLFRLVDTAGLRKKAVEIEKMGVEYSRQFIAQADLVLFIHEAGTDFRKAEKEFLKTFAEKKVVRVVNKIDLLADSEKVPEGYLPVSAKQSTGLSELREAMLRAVLPQADSQESAISGPQVTSQRQKGLLEDAHRALDNMNLSSPPEFVAADLSEVCDFLGEITGSITSEDVLDRVFSRFCVGK